jgi:hypothetical protein
MSKTTGMKKRQVSEVKLVVNVVDSDTEDDGEESGSVQRNTV